MRAIVLFTILALPLSTVLAAEHKKPKVNDEALRVQEFLDSANFGPGNIDGEGGEFTKKAIVAYEKAHGITPDGNAASLPLNPDRPLFTSYTVTQDDTAQIGNAPAKPAQQAKLKRLPYGSIIELVAEKFHSSEEFIRKLNPQLNGRDPRPGDALTVPNVKPFDIASAEAKRPAHDLPEVGEKTQPNDRHIDINVENKTLELRDGQQTLAEFPITPGSTSLPAPKGHWHVQSISYMPIFRYDKAMLYHGERSGNFYAVPPGPNSAVGIVWMSLNKKGVGIHGTNDPESIGRTTSHGCIRLSNWDADKLARMIAPGTPVDIQ